MSYIVLLFSKTKIFFFPQISAALLKNTQTKQKPTSERDKKSNLLIYFKQHLKNEKLHAIKAVL